MTYVRLRCVFLDFLTTKLQVLTFTEFDNFDQLEKRVVGVLMSFASKRSYI